METKKLGGRKKYILKDRKFIKRKCKVCNQGFFVYLSEIRKGGNRGNFCSVKCYSDWQRIYFRGENNSNWNGGKVEKLCKICKKKFTFVPSRIKYKGGKFCSRDCFHKWFKGENTPLWRHGGGRSFREYDLWQENRKKVLKRDNYHCRVCDTKDIKLDVHHIIPYILTKNDSSNNLMSLCRKHHKIADYQFRFIL